MRMGMLALCVLVPCSSIYAETKLNGYELACSGTPATCVEGKRVPFLVHRSEVQENTGVLTIGKGVHPTINCRRSPDGECILREAPAVDAPSINRSAKGDKLE